VKRPPNDELPMGSMPQAAEQHGEDEVEIGPSGPLTIATEGDV
jgi:hypothetical protein